MKEDEPQTMVLAFELVDIVSSISVLVVFLMTNTKYKGTYPRETESSGIRPHSHFPYNTVTVHNSTAKVPCSPASCEVMNTYV